MAHGAAQSSVFIFQMQIHKRLNSARVAKCSEVKIVENPEEAHAAALGLTCIQAETQMYC